jgi:hypothetical protein
MKILLTFFTVLFTAIIPAQSFKNITENSKGYIGIGTKNPDALLTVKGSIHTQEVLIDLEGAVAPDYVFEKYYTGSSALRETYEMLPLSEVESFIQTHHHLPGVKSAQLLQEEGIQLKEFNLLLLEKIEELTLYLIEQQHQITELKERLQKLENE